MKRILTIFAGREKYLSILKNYLDVLLENKSLTEVHLWNYARNDNDYNYIINICKNNDKYILFTPHESYREKTDNKWHEYYSYYINSDLHDSDILIKCDDDIVYIDVTTFERYISEIREDILYFPNIVNNDVGVYIQTKHGTHDLLPIVDEDLLKTGCDVPLTTWDNGLYKDGDLAVTIHRHFLNNISNYSLEIDNIDWGSRISINFFGGNIKTIKKYFKLYEEIGHGDDEYFFSSKICKHTNKLNKIVAFFVVSHFSFGPQNTLDLDNMFIHEYYSLSKTKNDILFILTYCENRNGIVDGNSIRYGGVGSSGTEQSVILIAEYLSKFNFNCYISSNCIPMYKIENNVVYLNHNSDILKFKRFEFVIIDPWINSNIKIPKIIDHLLIWTHGQGITDENYLNYITYNYGVKDTNFIHPSAWTLESICNNHKAFIREKKITQQIISNPLMTDIFETYNCNNKIKQSFIFAACWERGGEMALNIFNSLNWKNGQFHAFSYISEEIPNVINHKSCDKYILKSYLDKTEYFVYPLISHRSDAIHKDTFACVVAEALATKNIVITFGIGALPEIYKDHIIYIELPNDIDLNDIYTTTPNIKNETKNKIYNEDIIKKFVDKINYLENNPSIKEDIKQRGYDFAMKSFNIDNIGKKWLKYLNNILHDNYPNTFDLYAYENTLALTNQLCIPENHINYLLELKRNGFEPKVIYDIGACVLHWTNEVSKIWPNAKIYVFDAIEEYEFLYRKKQLDYHIGTLSNKDNNNVKYFYSLKQPGGSSYYREIGHIESKSLFTDESYSNKTTKSLDTVVLENKFMLPDLVKIDVQGAEYDIIEGGQNTIKHAKHLIVEMQNVDYNENAPKVDITLPYIESHGFKCIAPLFCNNGPDGDYGFVRNID